MVPEPGGAQAGAVSSTPPAAGGTPAPPHAPPEPAAGPTRDGPRVTREEVRDLGRLRRSVDEAKIAGVAAGLARHLDIDPIIVRVALVVLVFFGGAGLFLYFAAWLLVPEEHSTQQPLGLDDRSRSIALVGTGLLAGLAAIGDWAGAFWLPWPIVIVGLLVLMFLDRSRRRRPVPAAPSGEGYDASYEPQRDPRRRGPVLLWFALALIATGVGVLGVVDVSGVDVVGSAYPALTLAITAAMLLLGAFWGRAGGLVLVGLLAALATALATAGGDWESERAEHAPTSALEVRDGYRQGAGELFVDLSRVGDVDALGGRTLRLEGGIGRIEVVAPDGIDVRVRGTVGGPGELSLFGDRSSGFEISDDGFLDSAEPGAPLTIEVELGVGEVVVREQDRSAP